MRRKKLLLVLTLLLSAGLDAVGQARTFPLTEIPTKTEVLGLAPDLAALLDRDLPDMMRELHTPGLGVGVVSGNTLVYAAYLGWADIESAEPVSDRTFFRIGSISKSITAAGLLQVWEEGKFQLDDDINKYLPEPLFFPPHPDTAHATFRHLLTHTSGAGEFLSYSQIIQPGLGVMVKEDNYQPLGEYLHPGFHTQVDPGKKYAYSNYGFALLGYALECLSSVSFNEYMRKNVFAPLGMTETTYEHTADMEPRIATGYSYHPRRDRYEPGRHQAFGITPAGNVYTTVPEFALYVAALLNGGASQHGRILHPETVAMMMAKQHTFDPRQAAYGFGLVHYGDHIWGRRIVGHSGSIPFGYTAMMLLAPEDRVGVYVFANSGTYAPIEICWRVLKTVLRAQDEPHPQAVLPDRSVWPELVGYYGPEYEDFKTNTRLYMAGIGCYQVKVIKDELVLIYLWQGKKSAMVLHQVSEDDPYFFWYEDKEHRSVRGPHFLSFHRGENGRLYLVPGGLEEFVQLELEEEDEELVLMPLGRLLVKVNPF